MITQESVKQAHTQVKAAGKRVGVFYINNEFKLIDADSTHFDILLRDNLKQYVGTYDKGITLKEFTKDVNYVERVQR